MKAAARTPKTQVSGPPIPGLAYAAALLAGPLTRGDHL